MNYSSRSTETLKSVLFGSGITAVAGATTGATIAVLKNAPVKQYTISTGLNCGVFGATFFLVRETFITYQRQKNAQFGFKDSQTQDFDAVLSSGMAGITTGGLLSAAYKGPKSVVSGAIMFGSICTALQIAYTQANHWRQDYILSNQQLVSTNATPIKMSQSKNGQLLQSDKKKDDGFSLLKYINMPSWFPIHELSEEEYNELLDTKLKTLEAELAELEEKLNKKQ